MCGCCTQSKNNSEKKRQAGKSEKRTIEEDFPIENERVSQKKIQENGDNFETKGGKVDLIIKNEGKKEEIINGIVHQAIILKVEYNSIKLILL